MEGLCSAPGCNKKLPLLPFKCRCEKLFCKKHRLPETHNCSLDYAYNLNEKKEELKCVADKVIKI